MIPIWLFVLSDGMGSKFVGEVRPSRGVSLSLSQPGWLRLLKPNYEFFTVFGQEAVLWPLSKIRPSLGNLGPLLRGGAPSYSIRFHARIQGSGSHLPTKSPPGSSSRRGGGSSRHPTS